VAGYASLRAKSHLLRRLVVLLAVGVAVVAVRARGSVGLDARARELPGGPAIRVVLEVGGLTVGVLALALLLLTAVALWRRPRSAEDLPQHVQEVPRVGLVSRLVALALALAVIGGVAGIMVLTARQGRGRTAVRPSQHGHRHVPAAPGHRLPGSGAVNATPLLITAVIVFALAAGVAVFVVLRRARRRRFGEPPAVPGLATPEDGPSPSPGTPVEGPRAEIIGHYATLEARLAARQAARAPAETPDELLARAEARGLDTTAARALAGQYLLARYSERPVTPEDSVRAARILAEARRRIDARRADTGDRGTSAGGTS
jgi:hypothetical protein